MKPQTGTQNWLKPPNRQTIIDPRQWRLWTTHRKGYCLVGLSSCWFDYHLTELLNLARRGRINSFNPAFIKGKMCFACLNLCNTNWSFTHCNFNWYNLCSLSKDHTGTTIDTSLKMIPFARIKNLKNGQPYPVAHTHITNIREPPSSVVSKLLLILDNIW